jgi:hypothetical protein
MSESAFSPLAIAGVSEENAKVSYLEDLYVLDGRHLDGHPQRGHYTGLYAQRMRQLLLNDRREAAIKADLNVRRTKSTSHHPV